MRTKEPKKNAKSRLSHSPSRGAADGRFPLCRVMRWFGEHVRPCPKPEALGLLVVLRYGQGSQALSRVQVDIVWGGVERTER